MDAIVACYSNWGIGLNGSQPIVVPEDRKRFKELTMGGTVIVGYRTLQDFPNRKPLPGRENIVLTHQNIEIDGATVVHDIPSLLELVRNKPNVFVVGGASVYKQLLPYCECVYLTRILSFPVCDVHFEDLDKAPNWSCEIEKDITASSNGYKYQYLKYKRESKEVG